MFNFIYVQTAILTIGKCSWFYFNRANPTNKVSFSGLFLTFYNKEKNNDKSLVRNLSGCCYSSHIMYLAHHLHGKRDSNPGTKHHVQPDVLRTEM